VREGVRGSEAPVALESPEGAVTELGRMLAVEIAVQLGLAMASTAVGKLGRVQEERLDSGLEVGLADSVIDEVKAAQIVVEAAAGLAQMVERETLVPAAELEWLEISS
jgi:hypothetical protein